MKRIICILALAITLGALAHAATPEQMEQARVATFKACLRNMDNGSGYLDSIKPRTMEALESKLRKTEKANIESLKAIPIPTQNEYAGWDKQKFSDFWVNTFVNKTSGIKQKDYCRSMVKNAVGSIDVSVAEPAVDEQKPEEEAETTTETTTTDEVSAVPAATTPVAASDTESKEASAEQDATDEKKGNDNSNTGAIIVLCILVVVVILLVGYALNVMKKNKERQQPADEPRRAGNRAPRRTGRRENDEDYAPRTPATVIADPEEESPFAAYSAPLEEYEPRHERKPDPRDEEIERLRSEIEVLKSRLDSPRTQTMQQATRRRSPSVIYLAQANADGVFTRADARYVPGASIFKLVTTDGVSGSYSIIEDPEVFDVALTMPSDFLANACLGRNLLNPGSAHSIVNETSGTAIFDNGRWRVSRKAQIRYSFS